MRRIAAFRMPGAAAISPPLLAGPRIPQRHRAVEYGHPRLRILEVGHEIAVPLELEALLGPRFFQRGLELRADDTPRSGVQVEDEIAVARAGMRDPEQAVVEPHLGGAGVARAHPVNVALYLDALRPRRARFGAGIVAAAHG